MTKLLVIPPQPKWNIPEQRSVACDACAKRWMDKQGAWTVTPVASGLCELMYEGCLDV